MKPEFNTKANGDVPESVYTRIVRQFGLHVNGEDPGKEPPFPDFSREQWDRLEAWCDWKFGRLSDPVVTPAQQCAMEVAQLKAANIICRNRPKDSKNPMLGKAQA